MQAEVASEGTIRERRRKGLGQIGVGVALLIVAGAFYLWDGNQKSLVTNFAECTARGFPVMESYPRQCKTPDGQTFREDIGNELEKDNFIRVETPRPNTAVASPLTIKGMARGNWFFEASFPVRLLDVLGAEVARGLAQAKGEWMTTAFVPFEVVLTFASPTENLGILILERDNPSGLPENEDELRIPVIFEKAVTDTAIPTTAACVVGGCSGQICADEEMMSTCEFREEYACYKTATCERQASGKCGWTETSELRACINRTR